MRVAVVHDWLVVYGGAERVLESILDIFPEADLFAVIDFVPPEQRAFLRGKSAQTTAIQGFPMARKHYRKYLPFMPLAIEQLDSSGYDLIISSCHAVAKGIISGPHQLHVSYVHSPIRYAWDMHHQYLQGSSMPRGWRGWLARWILHRIRQWDVTTASRVDVFVANSRFIAARINKVYRRTATVIYPPVDDAWYAMGGAEREDFFVTASRMVSYKRIDLIVEAFSQLPGHRLVVIGDGPDEARIRAKAGANVSFLGHAPAEVLRDHVQRARAFVFAAEEDFGIAPVEAQMCGTPVIALGRGGVRETVVDGETGVFFPRQTVSDLVDAVHRFERVEDNFAPGRIRAHALQFGKERFGREFSDLVSRELSAFVEKNGISTPRVV
ncbi:MAG: glycosyltransferase family 4 protein [Armatimonadetes bacterium]|nr:glycosyltransferase family 4 protein [Armatimonadota bacterium]